MVTNDAKELCGTAYLWRIPRSMVLRVARHYSAEDQAMIVDFLDDHVPDVWPEIREPDDVRFGRGDPANYRPYPL